MAGELPQVQLRAVLKNWRDGLIDLGGRNRLLNFRHTRTATLEIREPAAGELIFELDRGWSFARPPQADEDDELDRNNGDGGGNHDSHPIGGLLTQKTTQAALATSLRRLHRESNRIFNDTGLWVLQLGVGFLDWREPGADGMEAGEPVDSSPP